MLAEYIRKERERKDILLMTHIVLGYPSFDDSLRIVEAMVEGGVELMELQIPFSEPIADGPVILHANQKALDAGSTVDRCMEIAEQITSRFDIPFLAMTYYNIAFARGLREFPKALASAGLKGAIIPDLPHEEGDAFFSDMLEMGLEPVFLFSPNTSDARMAEIAKRARGLLYCVARKGVTGTQTDFEALDSYLRRCKKATDLPLALGFGVQDREDVAALVGKVDIAIVGSQAIRVLDDEGVQAIKPFVQSLRSS